MTEQIVYSRRNVLGIAGGSLAGLSLPEPTALGETDYVEVNVGYDGTGGRQAVVEAAVEVVREFDFPSMTVRVPAGSVDRLASRDDVTYVEENGTMRIAGQTVPWGVEKVSGGAAPCDGVGADVAILDTGIDSDHPDLQANLGSGVAFTTCQGTGCIQPWDDDHGHGSAVAGVVGASDNFSGVVGVAPGVTLHAVKVLDSTGSGSIANIASGIQYVANRGWDVLNMSIAGSYSSTIASAVQYAHANGVLLVGAAGNAGPCSNCVAFPASEPEVVAVTAVDRDGNLALFGSQGPAVELAAPGVDIHSTWTGGGYQTLTGTSMACPHASAAGALLMAQGYSNTQVRTRLQRTANHVVGLSGNQQGHGLVNADAMCFG